MHRPALVKELRKLVEPSPNSHAQVLHGFVALLVARGEIEHALHPFALLRKGRNNCVLTLAFAIAATLGLIRCVARLCSSSRMHSPYLGNMHLLCFQ